MTLANIKNIITGNLKNAIGWRTPRKIVVFGVDDYGNVRVDSKSAQERMEKAGVKLESRFDRYDCLEDEEDLLMLYETLDSVKDKNGNPAVFTALTVPANINFEKMKETGYEDYFYESLPETFSKLPGYEKVWSLWQEGISRKLIYPQFHGREHLNLKVFNANLALRDKVTLVALENRSYTGISRNPFPNISFTAAFEFENISENEQHKTIIEDGLNVFEKVFGFRSVSFNPPGGREHHFLHKTLAENGVIFIEMPFLKREHQGAGSYKTSINYTGKRNKYNQTYVVRNCVFEPTEPASFNWAEYCLEQIDIAFRWNRPAIVSSHRVNFCGHIDPKYRSTGIGELKKLLKQIVHRWPEVEFMTTVELGKLIENQS